MRKYLYILFLLIISTVALGQRSSNQTIKNLQVDKKSRLINDVTIGSSSFDGSAILTITSSTQGMLAPRMNTAARDAITLPADGLLIYNNQTNQYEFFESTWQAVGGGNTIYSADDNLAGNRIVTMGANNLTFSGNLTTFKGIDAISANFALKVTDNTGVTPMFNVRNDGRTSIGHSSPQSPLDVQFLSGESLILRMNTNAVNASLDINWKAKNSIGNFVDYNFITSKLITTTSGFEDSQFRFFVMNSGVIDEQMRIYSNGHLSIGDDMNFNVTLFNASEAVDGDLLGMEIINTQPNTGGSINETASFHLTFGVFGDAASGGIIRAGKLDDYTSAAKRRSFLAFHTNNAGTSTEQVRIDDVGNVGIGTTTPAVSAKLEISTTTGALLFPRMTTTQRDALTAINGMVIYNSSLDKLQVRAGGSWVSLH